MFDPFCIFHLVLNRRNCVLRREYVCLAALTASALYLSGCGGHAAQSEQGRDGKTLYAAYCVSCHGINGRNDRGGAMPAMRLGGANGLTEARWNALVWNGRGMMPAFGKRLSTAQTNALRAYARGLTAP